MGRPKSTENDMNVSTLRKDGRGVDLTEAEQVQVLNLHGENFRVKSIFKRVQRSLSVVQNVMNRGTARYFSRSEGAKPKTTSVLRRLLLGWAKYRNYAGSRLRKFYTPAVAVRRAHQILYAAADLR